MRLSIKILPIFFLSVLWSCQQTDGTDEKHEKAEAVQNNQTLPDQNFDVDAEALLKDRMAWYGYHYRTIHLARDFTALDTDSSQMTKAAFLNKLASGNLVAFKTKLRDGLPIYTLYKSHHNDLNREATIKNLASIELKNLSWEGKEMPNFNFKDLTGKTFDNASIQGKILVLKCWFIGCTACVKEFPELNELVDGYRQNPDVLFVSLAIDTKPKLENFLKKKTFRYAVVAEQDNFMQNKLGIRMYPTHILVNRQGVIVKVVNDVNDLIPALSPRKLSRT